jgi:hypothetical protein
MSEGKDLPHDICRILELARDALEECSDDLESDVDARWKPNGVVHPANERRYIRDFHPVAQARIVIAEIDGLRQLYSPHPLTGAERKVAGEAR